jgi:hypothetical protein
VEFLFFTVRPTTVVELDKAGVRIPRRGTVPWSDVSAIKIYPAPGISWGGWFRYLSPIYWLGRSAFRSLGLVPKQGSGSEQGRIGRWRTGGAIPLAVRAQVPMKLEELAETMQTFAPAVPLGYGP